MLKMLGDIARYIDSHPRLILIMGWPVFTLIVAALIWIVWKGPWPADKATQQLAILGYFGYGFIAIFALGYLAQSMAFFGRLGVKVGSLIDVNADSQSDANKQTKDPNHD